MHQHWAHWPWAIMSSLTAAITAILAIAAQLHRIARLAVECYRRVRKALNTPNSSATGGILAGAENCRFLCCTSNAYPEFWAETSGMAIRAAQGFLGADVDEDPGNRAQEAVKAIYRQFHHEWLVGFGALSEADRLAELWKMLFTQLLRGRRRRRQRQKVALILSQHLKAEAISRIFTPPLNRHATARATTAMYDVVSNVIRELSYDECLVFLYKVFAELSEEEIARRTPIKLEAVKTYSIRATDLLRTLVTYEARLDLELLALLRQASREEGIRI